MEQFIASVITAVLGLLVFAVRTYIQANINPRKLQAVDALAQRAVLAAERFGEGLGGPTKYELAQDALTAGAKRLGVKLSADEINTYIHAALAGFEDAFGESKLFGPKTDVSNVAAAA